MIQNYIFDLYGTLVDIHTDESMPIVWKRMALLLSLQGAAYSAEELKDTYKNAVGEQTEKRSFLLPRIPKEHIEPDILEVFSSIYTRKSMSVSQNNLEETALVFRTLSMKHLGLYPKAIQVLRTLRSRGKGVYLLSNAQAAFTFPELRKLKLISLFDGIVLSSQVGVKKPNEFLFLHLFSKYGISPQTSMMVGNDMEADMQGAVSVGMPGRYIHTKQSPCRRRPLPETCQEIFSLTDLL